MLMQRRRRQQDEAFSKRPASKQQSWRPKVFGECVFCFGYGGISSLCVPLRGTSAASAVVDFLSKISWHLPVPVVSNRGRTNSSYNSTGPSQSPAKLAVFTSARQVGHFKERRRRRKWPVISFVFYLLWLITQNAEPSAPASTISEGRVSATLHYLSTLGGGCAQPVGHSLRVWLISKAQLDVRRGDGVLCVTGTRPGGAVL